MAAGAVEDLHLHPRRVRRVGRRPRRRRRRGLRGRLSRREHPRHRRHGRARRPPRRRRLHLRRGDGAARRARGQARQPAAQAAVPGDPGPLRRADADQQRRDAGNVPHIVDNGAEWFKSFGTEQSTGHQGGLGLGQRQATRQLRDRARHPLARADLRPRRRPDRRPRGQGLGPRRLLRAGAGPEELDLPYTFEDDGRGRLDARLGRDHRRRRHASRSRTWRCARRASTTTSRAASAPPAARAPTGP